MRATFVDRERLIIFAVHELKINSTLFKLYIHNAYLERRIIIDLKSIYMKSAKIN